MDFLLKFKAGAKALHKKAKNQFKKPNKAVLKKLNKEGPTLHDQVFENINCLDCAGCCKGIPPIVTHQDSKRIAKHLSISQNEFLDKYTKEDEDLDRVMGKSPCYFLNKDNTCQIYDVRPKACRAYPHTNAQKFSEHLNIHIKNIQHCPAVFQIFERLLK